MSSVITLTREVRKIPYFSDISDEKEVIVPRPLIYESILFSLEYIKLEDLSTIIENRVYLGLKNEDFLVKELLWKLGETEETWSRERSVVVQNELKPYLEKRSCEYVYGIRCLVPLNDDTCSTIALFGNVRLLKWAREEKGCFWDYKTVHNAYENNHLDVYKYFVSLEKLDFDVKYNRSQYYFECYGLKFVIDEETDTIKGTMKFGIVTSLTDKQVDFTNGLCKLKYNKGTCVKILRNMINRTPDIVNKEDKAKNIKILMDYIIRHDILSLIGSKFIESVRLKLEELSSIDVPGPYNPIEWIPLVKKKLFPEDPVHN